MAVGGHQHTLHFAHSAAHRFGSIIDNNRPAFQLLQETFHDHTRYGVVLTNCDTLAREQKEEEAVHTEYIQWAKNWAVGEADIRHPASTLSPTLNSQQRATPYFLII